MSNKSAVYRLLIEGETIEAGDELLVLQTGAWMPVAWCAASVTVSANGTPIRRKIAPGWVCPPTTDEPTPENLARFYEDIEVGADWAYLFTDKDGEVRCRLGAPPFTGTEAWRSEVNTSLGFTATMNRALGQEGTVTRNNVTLKWTDTLYRVDEPQVRGTWRLLDGGEVIEAGDEYYDRGVFRWFRWTANIGETLSRDGPPTRRRIASETAA